MAASPGLDSDGDGLPDDWERGFGRYEIVKGSFSWEQARLDAIKRGGHLATIINATEWSDMRAVLGAALLGKNLWLGGTDEGTEGAWRWVTKEKWSYAHWRAGEPSNDSLGTGHGAPENYLIIWGNETAAIDGNNLYWNDVPITGGVLARDGYVFERGAWTDPFNSDTDEDGLSDPVEAPLGSTYQIVDGPFTWVEAVADAALRNGHLAVITSFQEWQNILSQVSGGVTPRTNLWLGASDALTEGVWQWVTAEPFAYTMWGRGAPDNLLGENQLAYDVRTGGWNDFRGNDSAVRFSYLLEREFLSSTDANNPDSDYDGLTDGAEVNLYHTDPSSVDTDGDGVSDYDEVMQWKTSPILADTDGDGLSDGQELFVFHTDPLMRDTDGDGFSDGEEIASGTNPLDKQSSLATKSRTFRAVEIEFSTKPGESYQVQVMNAAGGWVNQGPRVAGDGQPRSVLLSTRSAPMKFWRVVLAK